MFFKRKEIERIDFPIVTMDGKRITDYTEQGVLTQKGILKCIDFFISDNGNKVLGFHDHPNEMWFTKDMLVWLFNVKKIDG